MNRFIGKTSIKNLNIIMQGMKLNMKDNFFTAFSDFWSLNVLNYIEELNQSGLIQKFKNAFD